MGYEQSLTQRDAVALDHVYNKKKYLTNQEKGIISNILKVKPKTVSKYLQNKRFNEASQLENQMEQMEITDENLENPLSPADFLNHYEENKVGCGIFCKDTLGPYNITCSKCACPWHRE